MCRCCTTCDDKLVGRTELSSDIFLTNRVVDKCTQRVLRECNELLSDLVLAVKERLLRDGDMTPMVFATQVREIKESWSWVISYEWHIREEWNWREENVHRERF